MPLSTYFKKYKHIKAALKASAGMILVILGTAIFLLSTFYSIVAFSKGLIPHGIIASLVSLIALVIVAKGIQLFWRPLTSWETRENVHKKKRQQSIQKQSTDLTSTEETLESETEQINQQMVEEVAQAELEPAPEHPLWNLVVPLEQLPLQQELDKVVLATEQENPEPVLPQEQKNPPAQTNTTVPIEKVHLVKAKEIPFLFIKEERAQMTQQPTETSTTTNVKHEASHMRIATADQPASKSSQSLTNSTQIFKASASDNTPVSTKSVNTGTKTIVPINATKPLQLISLLAKLVGQTIELIKNIKNVVQQAVSSTATTSAKAEPTATPDTPKVTTNPKI